MKKHTSEKKIKKKRRLKTLRAQIKTLYVFVLLLPLLVLAGALLIVSYRTQIDNNRKLLSAYNSGVRQTMYDLTTYIYNISDSIAYNEELSRLLAGRYGNYNQFMTAYNNTTIVDQYIAKYTAIGGIYIYSENPSVCSYGRVIKVDDSIKNSAWYQKANSQFTGFWTSYEYVDPFNKEVTALTLIRKMVVVDSGESAVVMIRVSNSFLNSRIENLSYTTIMTVNQEPIFFGTDPETKRTYINENVGIDYNRVRYSNDITTDYKGIKSLASVASLKPSKSAESQIYIVSYDTNAYASVTRMMQWTVVLLIVATVLPGIAFILVARRFTREIGSLRYEMEMVSRKNSKELSRLNADKMFSSRELAEAYNDLLLMAENIEKMEAQQYEAALNEKRLQNDQQKIEIKVLASQINPHFLYNTLEMIRMKALTNNDRDVATAIKLLGQSMRYVLENTGTMESTLKKELDHVMNYLQIQKLRFGERVDYQVNIQPDMNLEEYSSLPLIMQPIVENAIVHGLEKKESNGKIWVAIYQFENCVYVDISDNAGGMDEETVNRVLHMVERYESENHTSGIALYNINRRMKLTYGDNYGIEIHTVPGEGTRVRLALPIIKI